MRVEGLGFGVWGLGRARGLGFVVWGLFGRVSVRAGGEGARGSDVQRANMGKRAEGAVTAQQHRMLVSAIACQFVMTLCQNHGHHARES